MRRLAGHARADVGAQLRRRHELVRDLVMIVERYAAHERGAIESVVDARAAAMSASTPEAGSAAALDLSAALGRIFALAESYPHLRADEHFGRLYASLMEIEQTMQGVKGGGFGCGGGGGF